MKTDKAKAAFSNLGVEGNFDALNADQKRALAAYGGLLDRQGDDDVTDERLDGAKQAALDAVRDARQAGEAFGQPFDVATSKDPAVKNQHPTSTQGEGSGPAGQPAAAKASKS